MKNQKMKRMEGRENEGAGWTWWTHLVDSKWSPRMCEGFKFHFLLLFRWELNSLQFESIYTSGDVERSRNIDNTFLMKWLLCLMISWLFSMRPGSECAPSLLSAAEEEDSSRLPVTSSRVQAAACDEMFPLTSPLPLPSPSTDCAIQLRQQLTCRQDAARANKWRDEGRTKSNNQLLRCLQMSLVAEGVKISISKGDLRHLLSLKLANIHCSHSRLTLKYFVGNFAVPHCIKRPFVQIFVFGVFSFKQVCICLCLSEKEKVYWLVKA